MNSLAVIVLAAGKGKRMNNPSMAKVMALLSGKPLIAHVLEQVHKLNPSEILIIVGHQKDSVIEFIKSSFDNNICFVEQKEQLGTGHAVAQAESELLDYYGDILILSGDVPLLQADILNIFIEEHKRTGSDISVLTSKAPDPFGYGRIVRDQQGNFLKIVEQKDASDVEKTIDEINGGVYLVNSKLLFDSLKNVSNNNAQQEYYLTDIIRILKDKGCNVQAFCGVQYEELQGVNSPDDLRTAEEYYAKLNNVK